MEKATYGISPSLQHDGLVLSINLCPKQHKIYPCLLIPKRIKILILAMSQTPKF